MDNLEATRAEQARSAAQLNAIRAEDLRKTRIPITIVLQVHDETLQAIAVTIWRFRRTPSRFSRVERCKGLRSMVASFAIFAQLKPSGDYRQTHDVA